MASHEFKIARTFYLGAAGPQKFAESLTVEISWSVENETWEEAEEKAIALLYQMAERERRRRFAYLRAAYERQKAEANAGKPATDGKPAAAAAPAGVVARV